MKCEGLLDMALPRKCAIFPKVRKAYTISKSREVWSEEEHDKFLEALQLFDRDWKKIEAFVASKTAIQIRSHAQKYFLKVEKNGCNEHVPPPRPKRKAVHPYPQKASKIARATSQSEPQSLAAPIFQSDPTSAFTNQSGTNPAFAVNSSNMKIDFVQVYSFIGCVFDPNASDHLQRLKSMDPTNAKTVLLLMRNLSANLASPDFEEHKKVLFSYDVDREG